MITKSYLIVLIAILAVIFTGCSREGCTDPLAENFDPKSRKDDGSCIIRGCNDPDAANYNPKATTNDGSCIIFGCTDAEAGNYNPKATNDDGSCTYKGCMEERDDNFNDKATTSDPNACDPAGTVGKFSGSYYVTESCIYGNESYYLTIKPSGPEYELEIHNLYGLNLNSPVIAEVNGEFFIFSNVQVEGFIFSGVGQYENNKIEINFTVKYDGETDACSIIINK